MVNHWFFTLKKMFFDKFDICIIAWKKKSYISNYFTVVTSDPELYGQKSPRSVLCVPQLIFGLQNYVIFEKFILDQFLGQGPTLTF